MTDVQDQENPRQIRLFLEEICSELCRFQHVAEDGLAPEAVRINREVSMDAPGTYADIRVQVPGCLCKLFRIRQQLHSRLNHC